MARFPHRFLYVLRLLQMSKPHDLTAFRGGASYFDTHAPVWKSSVTGTTSRRWRGAPEI